MPSARLDHLVSHPSWYLPDGDMVLKVEGHAFKIPRSRVVHISKPLAALLKDAEEKIIIDPKNKSNKWDGCPKVTCAHDRHMDWNDMLCWIHDPNFLNKNLARYPNPDIARVVHIVSGLLRISTKYKMREFRRQAIIGLSLVIPTGSYGDMLAMNSRNPFFKTIPNIPREVVYLCRELKIGRFLPWAFYELSRNSVASITTYTELSGDDRSAILAGRGVVVQMQRTQIYRSFTYAFQASPYCVRPGGRTCRLSRSSTGAFESMLNAGPGPLVLMDPDVDLNDSMLCPICLEQAKTEVRGGQNRLWGALPSMFGLGNWDILYSMD